LINYDRSKLQNAILGQTRVREIPTEEHHAYLNAIGTLVNEMVSPNDEIATAAQFQLMDLAFAGFLWSRGYLDPPKDFLS
jgi:hypothetical protein